MYVLIVEFLLYLLRKMFLHEYPNVPSVVSIEPLQVIKLLFCFTDVDSVHSSFVD
jgi:hypothetical protein